MKRIAAAHRVAFGTLLALACLTVAIVQSAAESTPVELCGTTITESGDYHLAGDLGPCWGDGVVIAASDVNLTLGGHTLTGTSSAENCPTFDPQHGIRVAAGTSAVSVYGGTIRQFVDGINVGDSSYSQVSAMRLIDNCVSGVTVTGLGHRIDTNEVAGSVDGIVLCRTEDALVRSSNVHHNSGYGVVMNCGSGANRSEISNNTLQNNGLPSGNGGGVAVFNGDRNRIVSNELTGNSYGIFLSNGRGAVVRSNRLDFNRRAGIAISEFSDANNVARNTAIGNGVDLSDGSDACGSNRWRDNTYATDSVSGQLDGGPALGCIRSDIPIPTIPMASGLIGGLFQCPTFAPRLRCDWTGWCWCASY